MAVIDEPDVRDTSRYPAGKAADVLGINRSTLWRHTLDGLIRCGFRRRRGKRHIKFYTGQEIKRYWRSVG